MRPLYVGASLIAGILSLGMRASAAEEDWVPEPSDAPVSPATTAPPPSAPSREAPAARESRPVRFRSTVVVSDADAPVKVTPRCGFTRRQRACFPRGSFIVTDDMSVSGAVYTDKDTDQQTTSLSFNPMLSYAIADQFTVSGELWYTYAESTFVVTSSYGVGGGAGYNWQLGDRWSLWSRLALQVGRLSERPNADNLRASVATGTVIATNAKAQLLYHFAPNVFVGAGPVLFVDLAVVGDENRIVGAGRTTDLGAATLIGGRF